MRVDWISDERSCERVGEEVKGCMRRVVMRRGDERMLCDERMCQKRVCYKKVRCEMTGRMMIGRVTYDPPDKARSTLPNKSDAA